MKQFVTIFFSCLSWFYFAQTSYPSNTWIRVREKGKIGYIDPTGKMRIAPAFDHATDFQEGLAFVWSFPDEEQDKRDVPLGEEYVSYENFGLDGNRRTGIIDTTGKFVVEPKVNFEFYSHFTNGAALVEISNQVLFIDHRGKEIDYFAHYEKEKQLKSIRRVARTEGSIPYKYGYVDAFRTAKIQGFDEAKPFYENRAAVRLGEQFGYISTTGEMVIVPQFKKAGNFNNGFAVVAVLIDVSDQRIMRYGIGGYSCIWDR
jgi:WG containing repeat